MQGAQSYLACPICCNQIWKYLVRPTLDIKIKKNLKKLHLAHLPHISFEKMKTKKWVNAMWMSYSKTFKCN
jgi:hypothetical protein